MENIFLISMYIKRSIKMNINHLEKSFRNCVLIYDFIAGLAVVCLEEVVIHKWFSSLALSCRLVK